MSDAVQITEGTDPKAYNVGRGFLAGNPGRPKGIADKRSLAGRVAAQALADQAWGVVGELLANEDKRLALDAAKIVLEYAHGKPRQSLDIDVRGEAERIASDLGVPVGEIVAEAARLAAEAEN